jgi:hypothetical protein
MKKLKNNTPLNLTIITLIVLMGVFGCSKNDNNDNRQPPPPPPTKSLAVVVDNTGSSSNGELPQTVDLIKESLITSEHLSYVDVFNIGGNGKQSWEAIRQHFEFPVRPVNLFNEAEAKTLAKKNGCGSRKPCINREVEQARKQAEADYLREISSYNEERNNIIQKIGDAILQSPSLSPSCSDIQEQSEFVNQSSSEIVIWLSDGEHLCKTAFTGLEFKDKAVVLGVLPIKNEVAGKFKERFTELSSKFSNAQVKPISSFNKQMLLEFLAR